MVCRWYTHYYVVSICHTSLPEEEKQGLQAMSSSSFNNSAIILNHLLEPSNGLRILCYCQRFIGSHAKRPVELSVHSSKIIATSKLLGERNGSLFNKVADLLCLILTNLLT